MRCFPNRAISASAGTGKTFRLAHRYIGLLSSGVKPDRICALTFSRKAAGEIFDRIVECLCSAVTESDSRKKTAEMIRGEELDVPADNSTAYIRLLSELLGNIHKLRIGTLDSFILGIVRAFPMELGIPPETRPMDSDGGEAVIMRGTILANLFRPESEHGKHGKSAFLADFRNACLGRETKSLVGILDKHIVSNYEFFRRHKGDAGLWGNPDIIWKSTWWREYGLKPVKMPEGMDEELVKAFGTGKNDLLCARGCAETAERAGNHDFDRPWPTELKKTILERLLLLAEENPETAVMEYNRHTYKIPGNLWPVIRGALAHMIRVEAERALTKTRGLRAVLDRYHGLYTEVLRREGTYTFEDISRLLGENGISPTGRPDLANRLYIDYRLDGSVDHWLLDEFQDTSDTQWKALKNLIDETLQDEDRSFFYVGDIKQSIYGWRGGNYHLFQGVLDRYSQGPRAIRLESITECHRSLPAVIRTVNAVFNNLPGWIPAGNAENGPRAKALKDFSRGWQEHVSGRGMERDEGYSALLEYETKKNDGCEDDENGGNPAEFEAVAKVLEGIKLHLSRFTVAVLVRSNKEGKACTEVLRRRLTDIPVSHEGKGTIADSPVVALLLALVRYSAHTADTVALRHLQMSPLSGQPDVRDWENLSFKVLESIHERGFAGTLREWGGKLKNLNSFDSQRLRELLAVAEEFDRTGLRDPDAFADYIGAYQVRTGASAGTVRVMTIHQAKGLGFDAVIAPFDSKAKSFEKPGDPELLSDPTESLAGEEKWVLDPPNEDALEAMGGEPFRALEEFRTEANFAQLCVLYVNLTRAKRALYMIIPKKSKSGKAVREADLLRERLAGDANREDSSDRENSSGPTLLYECGNRQWFESRDEGVDGEGDVPERTTVRMTFKRGIARREPSKEEMEKHSFQASWLFGTEAGDVRMFGLAIHRLFQKIEWIEDADTEKIITEWREEASGSADFLADVESQFRSCLENDGIRRLLSRPEGAMRCEVWRETPFSLVLDNGAKKNIVSGRFDRIAVELDSSGRPARATVCDFKSNRIEAGDEEKLLKTAQGYSGQMADYAEVAGRLLGLPAGKIETILVFTKPGRTVRCLQWQER